jgi:hypothetical protein
MSGRLFYFFSLLPPKHAKYDTIASGIVKWKFIAVNEPNTAFANIHTNKKKQRIA